MDLPRLGDGIHFTDTGRSGNFGGGHILDLPPHTSEYFSQIYPRLFWNVFWTFSKQQLGSTLCVLPSSYCFWTGKLMDNSPSSMSSLNALIATALFCWDHPWSLQSSKRNGYPTVGQHSLCPVFIHTYSYWTGKLHIVHEQFKCSYCYSTVFWSFF
jgi:hypothetical protein